ncbi:MAG: chemotaxis protein CheW [Gammaproteobacteria bacterium]
MQATKERPEDVAAEAVGKQYLTFLLADEEYAVPILKVQEIKSWTATTGVPCTPDDMLGVINLRGAILPVFDLRRRFSLPAQDVTSTTAVIIVRAEGNTRTQVAGLVVDQVAEVYNLDDANIQPSADISGSINGQFITGLTRTEEKLVIVLNLDEILRQSMETIDMEAIAANG